MGGQGRLPLRVRRKAIHRGKLGEKAPGRENVRVLWNYGLQAIAAAGDELPDGTGFDVAAVDGELAA